MLIVSIILDAAMVVIAVLAAWRGRPYFYGLAFCFSTYVFYDASRVLGRPVEGALLATLFLAAVVAALVSVWGLYLEWETEEEGP